MKTRTGVVAALLTVFAAVSLSGCAIDAGSAAEDHFEKFMMEQENVIGASGRGMNKLPFYGSMAGEVTVRDDISNDDLETIVDIAGEYSVDHDGGNMEFGNVTVVVGGYGLMAEKTKPVNDDLRVLFDEVREDPLYVGGEVGVYTVYLDLAGVASADSLAAGLGTLTAHPVTSGRIEANFDGDESGYSLSYSGEGGRPDAAIAALQAIWSSTALKYASISSTEFRVKMTDEANVPAVTELVTGLLVNNPEVSIDVQGPHD